MAARNNISTRQFQWFHASPHVLEEGTKLAPGQRPSSFTNESTSSVFLSNDMAQAENWSAVIGAGRHPAVHIYGVTPHDVPAEHDSGFYGMKEWRSKGATVNKLVRSVNPNEVGD